jgi:hypothetical protein
MGSTTRPGIRTALVLTAVALFLTPVLGGKKRAPIYPITETMNVDAAYEISVIPPKVAYDSYGPEGSGRKTPCSPDEVSNWVREISVRVLGEKGFHVAEFPVGSPRAAEGSVAQRISSLADQYVRTRRTPEAPTALLNEISDQPGPGAVLVLYFEVKTAPKGYWNAWDGSMGVGMSNSDLRGALLDSRTGELLWRGEMYIRDVPDTENQRFETAISGVFTNLTRTEEVEQ